MPRAEKHAQILELRERGLTQKQIAQQLGCSRAAVSGILNDPDMAKQKARRLRYQRPCPSCGKLMDGSGGYRKQPTLCLRCASRKQHQERHWTQERVVAAIRSFAAQYGRRPAATDWLYERDRRFPAVATVQREFGSWNAAIEAAGFAPLTYRRRTTAQAIAAIRDFVSTHGRIPTVREFRHAADERPCITTYIDMFGSWNNAIRAAGFTPRGAA